MTITICIILIISIIISIQSMIKISNFNSFEIARLRSQTDKKI